MQKQIPTEATPVGPTKIENAKQQTARFHHKNYSGILKQKIWLLLKTEQKIGCHLSN